MFKSMNRRKGRRGYDQLISESTAEDVSPEPKMIRSTSLPTNSSGDFPVMFVPVQEIPVKVVAKQMRKVSKVHPLFSLLEKRSRKKKATAKPEFSRYMQYLKEGGIWDANSPKPVIY